MTVEAGDAKDENDDLARQLRGFGPLGILSILIVVAGNLVIAPLSAVLVLAWARLSRTPWREIGYVRPHRWIRDIVLGLALGVTLKLLMKAVVMPLLGADPSNRRYHYLVDNPVAVAAALFPALVSAGWGEETLFRGFFFERLGKLWGDGPWAKAGIVVLTSALFGLAHQGIATMQQAALVGLVSGTIYAVTRRLWLVVFAHAAFNLTALAIIYLDLETRIAHSVFGSK